MRPELLEIQYIESYLSNQLSGDQRLEFEEKMKANPEFARKVEAQRILVRRVQRLSVKQSVATAHRNYLRDRNIFYRFNNSSRFFKGFFSLSLILIVVYVVWLEENPGKGNEKISVYTNLHAPIEQADVPFVSQSFSADSSSILNFPSGTLVVIPSNSFVDEQGNPVKGKAELKFREFTDAIDIYLAGIPMDFSVDSIETHLESAAMCEIYAFQGNTRLQIKPGLSIEIIQSAQNSSESFNRYFFDIENQRWLKKGRDIPIGAADGEEDVSQNQGINQGLNTFEKPIRPQKPNALLYSFSIQTNPRDYPELQVFKNTRFEVLPEDTVFKPSYADRYWKEVLLKKTNHTGIYQAVFIRPDQKVEFLVRPVWEGEDYLLAEQEYQRKLDEYNKIILNAKHQRNPDSVSAGNKMLSRADFETVKELYRKRAELFRKKEACKNLKVLLAIEPNPDALLKNRAMIESAHFELYGEQETRKTIARAFCIEQLGLWNIDRPIESRPEWVIATFKLNGKIIEPDEFTLFLGNVRTAINFRKGKSKNFCYYPDFQNMVWAVVDKNKIIYSETFNTLTLNSNSGTCIVQMKEYPKRIENYNQAKAALSELIGNVM